MSTYLIQQPPSSSRPPVMYYTVRHNVTTDAGNSQMNTNMKNITIDGGSQPGHVYYIEVTAVNILGPGPPRITSKAIILCSLII